MIETRDLTKMYGDLYALNRLTIKLEKGSGTHERTKPPTAQNSEPETPNLGPDGKPIYKGTKGKLITTFPE